MISRERIFRLTSCQNITIIFREVSMITFSITQQFLGVSAMVETSLQILTIVIIDFPLALVCVSSIFSVWLLYQNGTKHSRICRVFVSSLDTVKKTMSLYFWIFNHIKRTYNQPCDQTCYQTCYQTCCQLCKTSSFITHILLPV